MKVGVGITTYNAEDYFSALYNSLPREQVDEIIVVNGGKEYKDSYSDVHWLQHRKNYNPSQCRNDCLHFLRERELDYYFIIEDDMVIKSPEIFKIYIKALQDSRLGYLCFTSTSWGSGETGKRTPEIELQFTKDTSICLYPNMCNEFTVRTKKCLDESGYFSTDFVSLWDVENVYNISKTDNMYSFWRFPDVKGSDDLIMNNPETESRINQGGKRDEILAKEYAKFKEITSMEVQQIPKLSKEAIIKYIHEN